jgi:protein-L-isoaspartate(D-aspartate) O-methyltransferase
MAAVAAEELREQMVARQIEARGIEDVRLLAAMREVPRERFVPADLADFAYEDCPLAIESGQTISQPFIVALMIEAARVGPGDRVLEVGAGSGYAAAVLGRVAGQVYGVERQPELADLARKRMAELRYSNIEIRVGDGTRGWPEHAPFDAILVAAGGPAVPEPLKHQLALGGRLVIPIGVRDDQQLVCVTRVGRAAFEQESLCAVRFVPLIGAHGWAADNRRDVPVTPARSLDPPRQNAPSDPHAP